jgi:SAM-dependent methyltransferase
MEDRIRWQTVLSSLARAVPAGAARVVVDGAGADAFADRLADLLGTVGRRCTRVDPAARSAVFLAAGPSWRDAEPAWDLVIWLRTGDAGHGEHGADIVVDLHDPDWPVIRRLSAPAPADWYVAESRAFFAARAATWDDKFGDDMPAYSAAVARAAIPPGATVLDAGGGTGRALPALREAVGPGGTVLGLDLTDEMLKVARERARASLASLVVGDVRRIPFADEAVDSIFAAGLIMHLPDVPAGLAELARVTRPGGSLVLFHPTGRAALAARHGRTLRPDEPLADEPLAKLLGEAGWRRTVYDDAPGHFFATAVRVARPDPGIPGTSPVAAPSGN